MTDHPRDKRPADEKGSSIELQPEWGSQEASTKPEPVAVRKPGDAGELFRRSAADQEDVALIEAESRSVSRQRLLAGIVLALLVAGAGVGLYLFQTRTIFSIKTADTNLYDDSLVALEVVVEMNRQGKVSLGKKEFPVEAGPAQTLRFQVPFSELKLGENDRMIRLTDSDGSLITERKIKLYHDFELKMNRSKLKAPDYEFIFDLKIPKGWTIRVQGDDYKDVKASVPFSLKEIFEKAEAQPKPEYRFDVQIVIVRPDQTQIEHIQRAKVDLPSTSLVVEGFLGKLQVVSEAKVTLRGRTEPGARLLVGGKKAEVAEDGSFETKVELGPASKDYSLPKGRSAKKARELAEAAAKKDGVEVEVLSVAPKKVRKALYFQFLRVSPEIARRYASLH